MPTLFDPIQIGDLTLRNRIFMAPLTRARAGDVRVPNALMAKYYAERASAGLILSEATSVTPQGVGYAATPGIWSHEQVAGWKLVTDAVHQAGGKIFGETFYHWTGQGQWQPFSPPAPAFSPSVRQYGLNERTVSTHAMGADEIQAMTAALRMRT